ncbi:hypothetical protein [Nostoc sp.]|uniref:hypothetical protein n=1 Tax=Nostoc sp. TaxID=1180 RepID=UPI002FF57E36
MSQATIHIFYWRDLLKQIGRQESDIPKDWDSFWEFWKQIQDDLRTKQIPNKKQNIYGLGFTFGMSHADTYYLFEHILEAYDVQILDSKGKLLIDDPKVRQKIVLSLMTVGIVGGFAFLSAKEALKQAAFERLSAALNSL